MPNKFHCEKNLKLKACSLVSKYVQMVYPIKMSEIKILSIIKHLEETQGAAFKWSTFSSDAWFFQINALNR